MVSGSTRLLLLAHVAVTLPPALLAGDCAPSSGTSIRLSGSSHRSETGHWVVEAAFTRTRSKQVSDLRKEQRPWHYDVDIARRTCGDNETLTTAFNVRVPTDVAPDNEFTDGTGFNKSRTGLYCGGEGQSLTFSVPVEVNLTTDQKFYPVGSEISIACDVDGYPIPQVEWFKDDNPLQIGNRIQVSESHRLRISRAEEADSGTYECAASNQHSASSGTVSVVVKAIPAGYKLFPNVGIYKLHTDNQNWENASRTCVGEGAHLAVVNSEAEEKAIQELIRAHAPGDDLYVALIGFHDQFNEGEYVTVFGDPLASAGRVNWRKGEPNNGVNGEDCGNIYGDGTINDITCSWERSFVCEKSI